MLDSCEIMLCGYRFNFNLFPRDLLNLGMPSYTFSCQTSFLNSMAHEGFDFNACIYDGKFSVETIEADNKLYYQ